MINLKLTTLGYGVVASLALGLSGCYMDGTNPQHVDYSTHHTMKTEAHVVNKHAAAKSRVSSSEVAQKATPGPKRAAAPQLPVIQ
jgi:hypothetical protein